MATGEQRTDALSEEDLERCVDRVCVCVHSCVRLIECVASLISREAWCVCVRSWVCECLRTLLRSNVPLVFLSVTSQGHERWTTWSDLHRPDAMCAC